MILIGLVYAAVGLVLIGIGLAIGFVAAVCLTVLIGLGIVSSSVFVGFKAKRIDAAFRALTLQCGLLAGTPLGVLGAWAAHLLSPSVGTDWPVLLSGAFGGATAGLILAGTLNALSRRAGEWASERWLTFKD